MEKAEGKKRRLKKKGEKMEKYNIKKKIVRKEPDRERESMMLERKVGKKKSVNYN